MFACEPNTLQVLDLEKSNASFMSIDSFGFLINNNPISNFMLKDRYGWASIKTVYHGKTNDEFKNMIKIIPDGLESRSILVTPDQKIPIYNGKYSNGFHGSAVYQVDSIAAADLIGSDSVDKFLFDTLNQNFTNFTAYEVPCKKSERCIMIETNSGMFNVNNFAMYGIVK